jgi:hypothetical protein
MGACVELPQFGDDGLTPLGASSSGGGRAVICHGDARRPRKFAKMRFETIPGRGLTIPQGPSIMSTFSKSQPPPPGVPAPDPYIYGWRDVPVHQPDGTVSFDQVPLTLEDVLFPETGDFIVQTDLHDSDAAYLKGVFKVRLAGVPNAAAVSDCRIDFNIPGVRPLGPDLAVLFGIKQHRDWAPLDLAAEGARPALVVEITSPQSRKNDLVTKVELYQAAKVPLYVIADAGTETPETRRLELIAYRYQPDGYERIAPDHRGWIWLEPVRLWLGVTADRQPGYDVLACYDPDTGAELGDYLAVMQALEAEARSRAAAESRAADAEVRIRELESELKRRNGPEPAGGT